MKIQNIKKLLALLLALLLIFAAVGCASKTVDPLEIQDGTALDEDSDFDAAADSDGDSGGADNSMDFYIDIKIDPKDIVFSLDVDDYGKDGWMFTSTGTMKMQIPEGWEINTALHESVMGVRSGMQEKDNDVIVIRLLEYSSMLTSPAERTPENQARQNYENTTITKDKWGNTDVWYRIYQWKDYTTITGFAAYNDLEYVDFDIRAKVVNGTVEEFMQSKAWDTLRTTFELVVVQ